MTGSIKALTEATRRRRESAERAVKEAITKALASRNAVTLAGIAAAAGVSPDFIYRHQELRLKVEALRRARSRLPGGSMDDLNTEAAESTLIRRLTLQLAHARRKHREEISELQRALEAAQGELLALRRRLQAQLNGETYDPEQQRAPVKPAL